jgi:hypothetical protein
VSIAVGCGYSYVGWLSCGLSPQDLKERGATAKKEGNELFKNGGKHRSCSDTLIVGGQVAGVP